MSPETLAKRRKIDRDNQQAVVQIFAEAAGFDHASEFPVGGRHDSHVHLGWACGADLFDLPLLNQAQDSDLQLQGHLADFVEQDRAAIGYFDLTFLMSQRAGERTLHVSEQLRFQ